MTFTFRIPNYDQYAAIEKLFLHIDAQSPSSAGQTPTIHLWDGEWQERLDFRWGQNELFDPQRFIQAGVAEHNMVGMAAGMSTMGFIPWVSTFAVFLAKRAADQIRVCVAYAKQNVKINGAHGGIPTGKAGATHQAVEDIAVMRCMPNMTVICPGDPWETRLAVRAATEYRGPVYLRTVRCPMRVIFDPSHCFEIGRSSLLHEGTRLTIISTGMMTPKALHAVLELEKEGVHARLLHMPTIKPLDVEAIVRASKETGQIITVENPSRLGGLGGAVAEAITEL